MMPGENHSKCAGVAADATAGTCQNCGVLQQSVTEYVAALLALKQKIIDSDHLLGEYQEKCDELKTSQREAGKLHKRLEELLEKMVQLEKQKQDYEAMRTELEERKRDLVKYEQSAEDVASLKNKLEKAVTEKEDLEVQLKMLEETSVKQSLSNAQIKIEKKELEKELKETKKSLETCQQATQEIARFKEENTKTLAQNKDLESHISKVEDANVKYKHKVEELTLDKGTLQKNLQEAGKYIEKLEKEKNKVVKNGSTQTNLEPAINKAKVRSLLEELWKCVEPQSPDNIIPLQSQDYGKIQVNGKSSPMKQEVFNPTKIVPSATLFKPLPPVKICSSTPIHVETTRASETPRKTKRKANLDLQQSVINNNEGKEKLVATENRKASPNKLVASDNRKESPNEEILEEILDLLKPLPKLLSPVQFSSPCRQAAVFGDMSDLSDDEDNLRSSVCDVEMTSPAKVQVPKSEYVQLSKSPASTQPKDSQELLVHKTSCVSEEDSLANAVSSICETTQCGQMDVASENLPCELVKGDQLCETIKILSNMLDNSATVSPSAEVDEETLELPVCLDTADLNVLQHSEKLGEISPQKNGLEYLYKASEMGSTNNPDINESHIPDLGQELPEKEAVYKPTETSGISNDVEMELQDPTDVILKHSAVDCFPQCWETKMLTSSSALDDQTDYSSEKANVGFVKDGAGGEPIKNSYTDSEQKANPPGDLGSVIELFPSIDSSTTCGLHSRNEPVSETKDSMESISAENCTETAPSNGAPLCKAINGDQQLMNVEALTEIEMDFSQNDHKENSSAGSTEVPEPVHESVMDQESVEKISTSHCNKTQSLNTDGTELHVANAVAVLDTESSDEQESFKLHRKVRTSSQRGINNVSPNKATLYTAPDPENNPEPVKPNEIMEDLPTKEDHSLTLENRNLVENKNAFEPGEMEGLARSEKAESKNDFKQESCVVLMQESALELLGCKNEKKVVDEKSASENYLKQPEIGLTSTITKSSSPALPEAELVDAQGTTAEGKTDEDEEVPLASGSQNCKGPVSSNAMRLTEEVRRKPKKTRIALKAVSLLAATDTPMLTKSPEFMSRVRSEMGAPLPPLLQPLTATPPKPLQFITSIRSLPGRITFPSPCNEIACHLQNKTPAAPHLDPMSPSDSKSSRSVSSPLQFCSATPKHAVPVPGRFPPSAAASAGSSPTSSQENSVRILDTMYPELSARARTLNILRGNVNLTRSVPDNVGTAPAPSGGFKSINSTSTAFTKTGKSCESESVCSKNSTESMDVTSASNLATPRQCGKRGRVNVLPVSAKRLRLDSHAQDITFPVKSLQDAEEVGPADNNEPNSQCHQTLSKVYPAPSKAANMTETILAAISKIETSCFSLLPVIKSHVYIKRISKVPVLREEEKEVVQEFGVADECLADSFLSTVLAKMKCERQSLSVEHMQALCRVYTGICRQRGDSQKVRLLAYCILKEDFPDSAKLILFIVTTWYSILPQKGVVCNAIQSVTRQRASGDVLDCLTHYLNWETNPPCEAQKLITETLSVLLKGTDTEIRFEHHERHGEDLSSGAWEHIFALSLLCTEKRWAWTHDNIIGKELWPIMNQWVMQPKPQQTPIKDVSVACVLRLIGRLGQIGIKGNSMASVKNLASVINTFGRHVKEEGVPWPVQLAAVYAIYDLSPCNPKEALEVLAAWRGETTENVPPFVTSCITQIGSVCRLIK